MPDNENLLGETPEVWTGSEEKKGAPVLDENDLAGLLGEEPQVWTGNTQQKGAPVLEEQVLLDEPSVPTYTPQEAPKHEDLLQADASDLLGGGEPEAYDEVAEFCRRLQFDDALKATFITLDAEKQQQVVEMRASQLGVPAPMIPNALRPKAEEALPESSDVELEEAPEPEEYVPQFKDEDLERIKEESKKPQKYTPPQVELTEEKKQENRRIMNELREEREHELAKKGFVQLLILTGVGAVAAICFGLFFGGIGPFGFNEEFEADASGLMTIVKKFAPVIAVVMGISSLLLALPLPQLKGISKFVFSVGFILSLFPGIPMLIQKASVGASAPVFLAALLGSLAVVVILSVSDAINAYNKHGNS